MQVNLLGAGIPDARGVTTLTHDVLGLIANYLLIDLSTSDTLFKIAEFMFLSEILVSESGATITDYSDVLSAVMKVGYFDTIDTVPFGAFQVSGPETLPVSLY